MSIRKVHLRFHIQQDFDEELILMETSIFKCSY